MLLKTILESSQKRSLRIAQTDKITVLSRQRLAPLLAVSLFVFTSFAISAPRMVAERAARGCSAPLWSADSRFIAYTTIDLDTLFVVEPAEANKHQNLYRVAKATGVGRRFVFAPGEERLVYREMIGAIPTHPDRLISTSFYTYDPSVLTSNNDPIIGPYVVENKIYYRHSLETPLIAVHGAERIAGPYKIDGRLVIRNASGSEVFKSDEQEEVDGFEISPDGQWVAAVLAQDGERMVKLIQVSDGSVSELGRGRWPGWSGNSNRLVFVRDKKEVQFAELVVYDVEVGQSRSVTGINQYWPDEPALNGDGSMVAFIHDGSVYVTETTGF